MNGLRVSLLAALAGALLATTVVAQEVRTFGTLREVMHEGRLGGRARIADALGRPNAYALGALAGLDGEFVVLDGKAYVSRPDRRGGVASSISRAGRDSVALMVSAVVPAWNDIRVSSPIPLSVLQDTLAVHAERFGLRSSGPFAFLIEGPVSNLVWHVADGRQLPPGPSTHEAHAEVAVSGVLESTQATLLGFYSDHHAGVFLHRDLDVHVHAYVPALKLAAHVDGVTIEPGATLRIPRVARRPTARP